MPVAANAARAGPAPSAAAWEWCRSAGACARPGLRPAASQALAAPARPGSLEDLRLRYERLRAAGRRSWQGAPLQRMAQHRARPEQGRQSLPQRLRLARMIGAEVAHMHVERDGALLGPGVRAQVRLC